MGRRHGGRHTITRQQLNITTVTEKWLQRNGKFSPMTCLGTRLGRGRVGEEEGRSPWDTELFSLII